MYNSFFGFKEKPFKLVPNPDYLFMSKSHEIAMAHLIYATDQGDGFVVITGEVGTGKTTLCRNFLELLNDHTESAYIFNPNLNSAELLSSICTEFGITHSKGTVKELLDALNTFLIQQNEAGRKAILLVDEAQNLTVENLEMIRMLSNLETTRSKLLQIVLVGQPELNHKLDSHELRQLAQRISLSYYLTPLSPGETAAYIKHRVHIAAQRQNQLFSARASRMVHRYANGIPRLINIACDRALLTAYSLNLNKVTGAVVKTAINELAPRRHRNAAGSRTRRLAWGAAVLGLLAVAALIMMPGGTIPGRFLSTRNSASPPAAEPVEGPVVAATAPGAQVHKVPPMPSRIDEAPRDSAEIPAPVDAAGEQDAKDIQLAEAAPAVLSDQAPKTEPMVDEGSVSAQLTELDTQHSRVHAAEALLALWQQPQPNLRHIPPLVQDSAFFDIAARQYGLRLYTLEDNWPLVRRLNMPVIIAVHDGTKNTTAYLTLVGWRGERMYLQGRISGKVWDTDLASLQPYLQGPVHVFWKNILGFDAIISQGASNQAVLTVKELLRQAGYAQIKPAPIFDAATAAAVVDFQARHKLEADGLVGPLTKMMLINAVQAIETPRLNLERGTGA